MGSLGPTGAGQTLTMRHIASFLVLALVPLSLGKPGMLTWICKTCQNPTMIYTAEAQINAGDGAPVGQLRLVQHVARDDESGVAGPVMIDTVDNREKLASLKTYSFQVQIQKGSCNNLGDIVASQYCRGCTNSLGVAMIKDKDNQEVALSQLSDSHSIVFFDAKNSQSKLGCGEIKNGAWLKMLESKTEMLAIMNLELKTLFH